MKLTAPRMVAASLPALALMLFAAPAGADEIAFADAICRGDTREVLQHLDSGIEPDLIFREGRAKGFTPLVWAVSFSPHLCKGPRFNKEILKLLLRRGADVNKPADIYAGTRPVMEAANSGDVWAVRLFLGAGADPNLTDERGYNALMGLARSNSLVIGQLLVDAGIDVAAIAPDGMTALDTARAMSAVDWIAVLEAEIDSKKRR